MFCLFFDKFQPSVAYKSVAYKKKIRVLCTRPRLCFNNLISLTSVVVLAYIDFYLDFIRF